MNRQTLSRLASYPFDVVIIGAGINGAGIARDAAMRGLRVLVLDKGDIAGGTTSYSTRLIHGGLRYLEYGELGLVRESLRERERLFHIAPHLVKPVAMIIPVYAQGKRGWWTIRAGMIAYDLLSLDKSVDHHHMLSRASVLQRAPGLDPKGLKGAALFFDAQVEYAERLAVENALSARAHGATILTYARVERLLVDRKTVCGVQFTDLLGGATCTARAPVVVNVTGPWVDEILAGLEVPGRRMIGGTKGSHLIVAPFPGCPRDALYVEALSDQRPFFIIPWNDLYLIGTTDSRYEGDLDDVRSSDAEIDYLLGETNRVIPQAHLTRESVLFTYSGVRPLPQVPEGGESGITRRHFLHDHAPRLHGFLSIVGGKLTTYRALAEITVDRIYEKLGRRKPRCLTSRKPLPGAPAKNSEGSYEQFKRDSLPAAIACRLFRTYGVRALEVTAIASKASDLGEPLGDVGLLGAEIVLAFREEQAETLSDALLRRTMVGLGPALGEDVDEAAARIGCKYLGWSESRAEQEVAAHRANIERLRPRAHISA